MTRASATISQPAGPAFLGSTGAWEEDLRTRVARLIGLRTLQVPKEPLDDTNRWAVIVASPTAATAWEELKAHQVRWPQIHFQLHVPYHDSSSHYAIVVGRRLSKTNAAKLVEIVQQAGMAPDSYQWPLPMGKPEQGLLAGNFLER